MSRDEKRGRLGPRPKAALAFHCYRNDGKRPWDESQKTWQTGQPQTGALESTFPRIYKAYICKTVRETEFKVKPAHADFLSGAFFLKGFSPIAPPASEAPLLPEAYFFQPVSIPRKRSKKKHPRTRPYSPAGAALYRQTPSFARTFWLPKEPLGLDNSNPWTVCPHQTPAR